MQIVIFGAGNCGRLIAQDLVKNAANKIVAFIDNDPQKAGESVLLDKASPGGGVKIYPSNKLKEIAFDKVIVGTFTGYYEISSQLQEMGIAKEKIDVSYIELSVRARVAFLEDFAKECGNLDGACAELGVYRGDFARYINSSFPHKKLYLFDTFEGFWAQDISNDSQMAKALGKRHFANTSIDLVLGKMPYREQCVVKKGWFPESSKGVEEEHFCFVNLDADLYEPILAGLEFFYPRMVRGGVILVHEYFSAGYVGVKEAVLEFISKKEGSIYKIPIGDNLSIAIIKT